MKTLLFLGDSITDCNHSFDPQNLGYGYVRMIFDKLNTPEHCCQVRNLGFDGFTVPALRRLWKRSCLGMKPELITILIGVNDLGVIKNTGLEPIPALESFEKQYQTLIDEIRVITDCPILLIEPFIFPHPAEYLTWEPLLKEISSIIQKLAKENQLDFLPLWATLSQEAKNNGYEEITTDGLHLTSRGHQIISDLLVQWIRPHLHLPS